MLRRVSPLRAEWFCATWGKRERGPGVTPIGFILGFLTGLVIVCVGAYVWGFVEGIIEYSAKRSSTFRASVADLMLPHWEWGAQHVRYFPFWLLHPIEWRRSERFRKAINLIGDVVTQGEPEETFTISMGYENGDWDMDVTMRYHGAEHAEQVANEIIQTLRAAP